MHSLAAGQGVVIWGWYPCANEFCSPFSDMDTRSQAHIYDHEYRPPSSPSRVVGVMELWLEGPSMGPSVPQGEAAYQFATARVSRALGAPTCGSKPDWLGIWVPLTKWGYLRTLPLLQVGP